MFSLFPLGANEPLNIWKVERRSSRLLLPLAGVMKGTSFPSALPALAPAHPGVLAGLHALF